MNGALKLQTRDQHWDNIPRTVVAKGYPSHGIALLHHEKQTRLPPGTTVGYLTKEGKGKEKENVNLQYRKETYLIWLSASDYQWRRLTLITSGRTFHKIERDFSSKPELSLR